MRILVLGCGAIGSVFGGFLAKDGHKVILLGRKGHMDAINRNGLLIEGLWGRHRVTDIRGYTSLNEINKGEGRDFDLALLTVKSYDTANMLRDYLKALGKKIPMISLQNGVENIEEIAELVGREYAIGGRVIFGAEIPGSGNVKVTVYADKVLLGGLDEDIEHKKVQEIADVFSHAGIPTAATHDILRYIWEKMLYNGALNALGSILEVRYGALMETDETRNLMAEIVREIFQLIEAKGLKVGWGKPEEYIEVLFEKLIPPTYDHFPSMLQDLRRGKKTEIDAMNGAIVRMGKELGLDLPTNKAVTQLVRAKEKLHSPSRSYLLPAGRTE